MGASSTAPSDPGELVAEVLRDYGALTKEALARYVPQREPRRYLYEPVADYPRRGGRMLRPSLCVATAVAFGAEARDALPTAASIELLHNALLIHDDIEDESEERRGEPTLHERYGMAIALNAGDVLFELSFRPLLDNAQLLGAALTQRLIEEFLNMGLETGEGQALDLGWRRDNVFDVTPEEYLVMVLQKTCWLTTLHPLRMGALIGTRGEIDPDRLSRFGFFLGAAFQLQDDLLNLVGDHESYGKEIEGDLWEGKRTLMLIHLYQHASDSERRQIEEILGSDRQSRSTEGVRWIRKLMDERGSIEYAKKVTHALAGAAIHECEHVTAALGPGRERDFLRSLPIWVLERS
jgi:geranylgeranyl diphosphate synthase type II